MPQFGHVISAKTIAGAVTDVVLGMSAIHHRASNRLGNDARRATDPEEPTKIPFLLAVEWTQAAPES